MFTSKVSLHIQDKVLWVTYMGLSPPSKKKNKDRGPWGDRNSSGQVQKKIKAPPGWWSLGTIGF